MEKEKHLCKVNSTKEKDISTFRTSPECIVLWLNKRNVLTFLIGECMMLYRVIVKDVFQVTDKDSNTKYQLLNTNRQVRSFKFNLN